ncbi:MAG: hypothetical protein R3325_09170 [Thermoanaerobaculia bacterium]|nr:hypothetical protein [Thermoanaerobaculia bacterium]
MTTLTFDVFWNWLLLHPNCIVRAGTGDAVLYDDEDLHWHFAADGATLYVQIIRGKRLMGELILDSERIAYVQELGEEREGEWAFELIAETDTDRVALYYFILSHGFEEEERSDPARVPKARSPHTVH